MSVVQTILVYVLIPAAIYGAIALMTLWPKFARAPRYRPGQPWTYEPLWWSANPDGAQLPAGRVSRRCSACGLLPTIIAPARSYVSS